jgi:hypothetical protein
LSDANFVSLVDVESGAVRKALVEYAVGRSASNDILIFCFSGHAIPIGNNDIGLCAVDTQVHQEFEVPISLSTVRFSEIVETLASVRVDPIIILDACYSGQAGVQIQQLYTRLNGHMQESTASTYALLCSSTRNEVTLDLGLGSSFSKLFVRVAGKGLGGSLKGKEELSLHDLFPAIRAETERQVDINAQLFLGETLPQFGILRNAQYKERTISLTKGHRDALLAFWNNGNPRPMTVSELQKYGSSVHTTYKKLGYAPGWALVEDVDRNTRQLTDKGLSFVKGEIKIPRTIIKMGDSSRWEPMPGSKDVSIADLMSKDIT